MIQFKDSKNKIKTITCPRCGREYLPAEIFIPNAFFGKPYDVERLDNGKIDFFSGTTLDVDEKYTCDRCHSTFTVHADINFQTAPEIKETFKEEYSTPVRAQRISLFEGKE